MSGVVQPLNVQSIDERKVAAGYFRAQNDMMKMPTIQDNLAYRNPACAELALPIDEDEFYNRRGENFSDTISCMIAPAGRLGLILQVVALTMMIAIYYGNGGSGSFTFDLYNAPEELKTSSQGCLLMIIAQYLYLAGTGSILSFQIFLSDSSKKSRGFRTGSKCLYTAAVLDIFVSAIRLLGWFYTYTFMAVRWYDKFLQNQLDWVQLYAATALGGIALIFYAMGFFYLETYDDEGTAPEFANILLGLFATAGVFQISTAVTSFGAFFSFIQLAALVVAAIWMFSFEPLQHHHCPSLHDRNITSEEFAG